MCEMLSEYVAAQVRLVDNESVCKDHYCQSQIICCFHLFLARTGRIETKADKGVVTLHYPPA